MSYFDTFQINFDRAQREYDNRTDDRYEDVDDYDADEEADQYDTFHGDDDGDPREYDPFEDD